MQLSANQHFGWPSPPHRTVLAEAGGQNVFACASVSTLRWQLMRRQWWPPALLHSSSAPLEAAVLVSKFQVLP
jgi:hypothetical protein